MSATPRSAYEGRDLPWRTLEQQTHKLQTRSDKASRRGEVRIVHRLQRRRRKSWAAKCLAVRKGTPDNRGKQTAGGDGGKRLAPAERRSRAAGRHPTPTGRAVRRVGRPTPGKTEQRPLGIPTRRDRAAHTRARVALEPEWAARFEPHRFGFRPGRAAHEAIAASFHAIHHKATYVLDADSAAGFDRLDHAARRRKRHTFPFRRRTIRGWRKAGILAGAARFPADAGTPQGGPRSPLLAHVARHGRETAVRTAVPEQRRGNQRGTGVGRPAVIRYADDVVLRHEDRSVIEPARQMAAGWLAGRGRERQPAKTRGSHTLRPHEGHVGCTFLGFEGRQPRVGDHRSGRLRLGCKTISRPSKDAQQRQVAAMARRIRAQRSAADGAPTGTALAPQPDHRGWGALLLAYYSRGIAADTFSRLDHLVSAKRQRGSRRRHPAKGRPGVATRYGRPLDGQQGVFRAQAGATRATHATRTISRHGQGTGDQSPFDGDHD